MDEPRLAGSRAGTPELREAVRIQVVVHGRGSSRAIAAALGVDHAVVVRVLRRFAPVGALAVRDPRVRDGALWVDRASLTARFRDRSVPLW